MQNVGNSKGKEVMSDLGGFIWKWSSRMDQSDWLDRKNGPIRKYGAASDV